jgi:hypothetical protein
MPAIPYRAPTETTEPIANTTAGLWTFAASASGFVIQNGSGQAIYIKLNPDGDPPSASYGDYDYLIATAGSLEVYAHELGGIAVSTLGVWFPAAATVTNFHIRGIG